MIPVQHQTPDGSLILQQEFMVKIWMGIKAGSSICRLECRARGCARQSTGGLGRGGLFFFLFQL